MRERVWICGEYVVFIDDNNNLKWFVMREKHPKQMQGSVLPTHTLTSNPLDLCLCYDVSEFSLIVLKPQKLSLYRFSDNSMPKETVLKKGDFKNCSLSKSGVGSCIYLNSLPGRFEFETYSNNNVESSGEVNKQHGVELERTLGADRECVYLTTSDGNFGCINTFEGWFRTVKAEVSWWVPAKAGRYNPSSTIYYGNYKSEIVHKISFNNAPVKVKEEADFRLPSKEIRDICCYKDGYFVCRDRNNKIKYLNTIAKPAHDWNWKDVIYKREPLRCRQLYVHYDYLYIINSEELIRGSIQSGVFIILNRIPLSMIATDYWLDRLKDNRVNSEHIKKDLDERIPFLQEYMNNARYADYKQTIVLDELDKTKTKKIPLPYFLRDVK